ncbi:hypothetical protein HYN48_07830 [Flavobacterium magnum]|uniref:DUF4836 domain-containing protein n=1 Tax=Flavobacterium magnum TaxID=2162713 RepID=A0A2S0RFX4_9FLAO|nr:hypothetical protein [Flavobacterium magnum]AWA29991.1 hypothetical protein HYN48_07830 [Flavobacterium magnum]
MKKIIYGLAVCLAILMASCGKDSDNEEILKYTTEKTLAIVKINLQQLDKKLPKDEMLNDKTGNFSDKDREKMELFLNADKNGVDIERPLYLMTDQDRDGFAFSFFGWLADQSKFTANFSKITGSKIRIDATTQLIYANDQLIGSIQDDMIVLSRHVGNPMAMVYGGSTGSPDNTLTAGFYTALWKRKPVDNKNAIDQIEKSLDSGSDVSSWINLYGMINTFSKGYIETLAVNKLLIGAGFGVSLNFGEGKIAFKGSTFFNDDLKKLVQKFYNGKTVDYNIVKNIEIDRTKNYSLGYMSPEFIRYFVKEAGFESMANNFLESRGITLEEITNALTGQYAFTQFREDDTAQAAPQVDEYGFPVVSYAQPKFLLALGIHADKAQKLIGLVTAEPMLEQNAKVYHDKELLVVATNENDMALLKTNKPAVNSSLKKQSGVTGYSWSDASDANNMLQTGNRKLKVVSMESISNVRDGNFTSEVTITVDKSKKNVLHYLMGYE